MGENASVRELLDEVAQLRKQFKRAELESEIRQRATAHYAKDSLCSTLGFMFNAHFFQMPSRVRCSSRRCRGTTL